MPAPEFDESRITHGNAELSGVRLHYVEAGEGPLVVLLHGFPEYWYSWRHQLLPLADAGYRVVAPDMRGYNLSDKPAGVHPYSWPHLAGDVKELIEVLGETEATVVGHDWGAVVAWVVATVHPEVVTRLAILNVPHPAVMRWRIFRPGQLIRSWYVFFFQLPWVPELLLKLTGYAPIRWLFRTDPRRPGAFDEADIDRTIAALRQPGSPRAPISYYRAAVRDTLLGRGMPAGPIGCPVLVLWGEHDRYLGIDLAAPPTRWVPDYRLVRIPEASHWVQMDAPEKVNRHLLELLGS